MKCTHIHRRIHNTHSHTLGLEYYDFAKQFAISTNAICVYVSASCRLLAENRYCTREILRKTLIHTHMLGHIDIPTH